MPYLTAFALLRTPVGTAPRVCGTRRFRPSALEHCVKPVDTGSSELLFARPTIPVPSASWTAPLTSTCGLLTELCTLRTAWMRRSLPSATRPAQCHRQCLPRSRPPLLAWCLWYQMARYSALTAVGTATRVCGTVPCNKSVQMGCAMQVGMVSVVSLYQRRITPVRTVLLLVQLTSTCGL